MIHPVKIKLRSIHSFLSLLLVLHCAPLNAQTGTTLDFYLTPSISAATMQQQGTFLKNYLEKETGLAIQLHVPDNYEQLVEKFGGARPCFAMMSSQSYVLANKKYGAQVKLRAVRFGHSVYYGMIVANTLSGIKKLTDLQGKTIAYTDALSTSGYLFPRKLLERSGTKPGKELWAGKHDDVIKLVYEGKADAGAAFYSPPSSSGEIRDARERVKKIFPDVEKKVIIIAKTEGIPNDPVVFSKSFDAETARKLYTALVKLSQDGKGKQVLLELYGIEGFAKASDADYNSLRAIVDGKK